jgi:hypothetical protein
MIDFIGREGWEPKWEISAGGREFIDLTGCDSINEVMLNLGRCLRGSDSRFIRGNSVDAFIDVLGDWFSENWESGKEVCIKGRGLGSALVFTDLAELVEIFHLGFDRAAHDECPDDLGDYLAAKRRFNFQIYVD